MVPTLAPGELFEKMRRRVERNDSETLTAAGQLRLRLAAVAGPATDFVLAAEVVLVQSGDHGEVGACGPLRRLVVAREVVADMAVLALDADQTGQRFHHPRQTRRRLAFQQADVLENGFGRIAFVSNQTCTDAFEPQRVRGGR